MAKQNNSMFNMERDTTTITIVNSDGTRVTTTYGNMIKARKAKERAEKKNQPKRVKSEVQLLPQHIERLVKGVKTIKSLSAFYDNGYRQWGKIARKIMDNPFIRSPYTRFRGIAYDIAELQGKINEVGKGNEKAIFQYIDKMTYKLDDCKKVMNELAHGVEESKVCEIYADKEIINGETRRLGLRTLMMRVFFSLNDMDKLIKELTSISDEGLDVLEYCPINGKRI